jgi:hypothetical protein
MPLVNVEHARNAPLITSLERCAVRNVFMAGAESMSASAEAFDRDHLPESEYVGNYNDCYASIRAFTHIREKLNAARVVRQIRLICLPDQNT